MNKLPVEEQAAQLTEEEKAEVMRVGKISMLAAVLSGVAAFLVAFCLSFTLMTVKSTGPSESDNMRTTIFLIAAAVLAVIVIVLYVNIKKKCPKYNDKLYSYLRKQQKQGK